MRSVLLLLLFSCQRAASVDAGAPLDGGAPDASLTPLDAGALPTLAEASPEVVVQGLLRTWVDEENAARLERLLDARAKTLHAALSKVERCEVDDVSVQLARLVAENLAQKHATHFALTAERIERQVIEAEAFKLETFVNTGVFPKRYFGYVDQQWDTASYETRMLVAATKAAEACNTWLEQQHLSFRVTAQELVVTFLAEGGAILLREKQEELESIHPVFGIGLDDIAKGFVDLAPLVALLDAEVGTHLADIVVWRGGAPYLSRNFRFEEAVAGTAAMWVWEKQIAERKLAKQGRASLAARPLDEQFVITSLVYNSGILFDEKTIAKLRGLNMGAYVYELSESSKAKRWPLPVLPPKNGLRLILEGGDYPEQGTSWSTIFHVLQRYGGYVGLSRYTDVFRDDGTWRSK